MTEEFLTELKKYMLSKGIHEGHFQYNRYIDGHTDIERFNKYFDEIEKFLPLKGARVLDIGCGTGGSLENLAKRGAKVNGIELVDGLIHLSNIRASQFEGSSCIKGDALNIPFPGSTFDACISMDLIEHLDDPDVHFREMIRVLKPGGIISLSTPNWLFRLERHTRFRYIHRFPLKWAQAYARFIIDRGLFSREYRERISSMLRLRNYNTVFSLKKLAKKHGLKVLSYWPHFPNIGDPVIRMLLQKTSA